MQNLSPYLAAIVILVVKATANYRTLSAASFVYGSMATILFQDG